MKKNDFMFELLESYNDSEDIGPNLWFFISYLKSKKHKIVYKPIIQIKQDKEVFCGKFFFPRGYQDSFDLVFILSAARD